MTTIFDKIFYNVDYNKIAIVIDSKNISYGQLLNDTISVINYLNNFKKNKKIATFLENSYLQILIFLACSKLSKVLFPIENNISEDNYKKIINFYKFDICIFDINDKKLKIKINNNCIKLNAKKIQNIIFQNNSVKKIKIEENKNLNRNDYLVLFSSGTTGKPKAILLSQKNKYERSIYAGKLYKFNRNECVILNYSLNHSVGQRLLFMGLIHSGKVIVMSNHNPYKWYKLSKMYNVSFSIVVSFHIKQFLKLKLKLNSLNKLKNLVSVSDVLEDNIRKKLLKYNFNFHEIYGTAEISTITNIKHRKNSKNKSVGKILNYGKIKILNDKFKVIKNGDVGQIACKSQLMFKRYYLNKYQTKKSLHNGYFLTGDMGYIKNNFLYFSGRSKNIIRISGITIYPEEIEKKLKRLKCIKNCIVQGVYDENFGERIKAIIISDPKNEYKIYQYCIKNLEIYKIPSEFKFVEKFKTSSLGKIIRS